LPTFPTWRKFLICQFWQTGLTLFDFFHVDCFSWINYEFS
jgi:hypothetical protein